MWRDLAAPVELTVVDDEGDRDLLPRRLDELAARCDVVLGPYSTVLTRAAASWAARAGRLLWNHGGSGDDVQTMSPGHVVSVLTPTSRYAGVFLAHLGTRPRRAPLLLAGGRGSFARQVLDGAAAAAATFGVRTVRTGPDARPRPDGDWDVFSAGTFEDDTALVQALLRGADRPRTIGSVAAGVRDFGTAVEGSDGVFGVAQWAPGRGAGSAVGPSEAEFRRRFGESAPDYPAVQVVAAAALAAHCVRLAGGTDRPSVWSAATSLDTSTLFGAFAVDPVTGAQRRHEMTLMRWRSGSLGAV